MTVVLQVSTWYGINEDRDQPSRLPARPDRGPRREASEGRSAFFRLAADRLLREREMADRVAGYVAGHVREPEGPGEIEADDDEGIEVLAGEEWE